MQLQIHRRSIIFDFSWSSCHQRSNLLLTLTLSKLWFLIYWVNFSFIYGKIIQTQIFLGKKIIAFESISRNLNKALCTNYRNQST